MGTHFSREFEKNMIIIFIIYSGKIKLHFLFFLKKAFCDNPKRKKRFKEREANTIPLHGMGERYVLSCLSSLQLLYLLYMFISSYLSKYSPVSSMYYCIHSTFTWDIKRRLNLCLQNNSDLKVLTKYKMKTKQKQQQ